MNIPTTITELIQRANALTGLTLSDLATQQNYTLPENFQHHKGWVGQLLEQVLGASAGSKAEPDFPNLGVELKTIPLNAKGKPKESTFVCAISAIIEPQWQGSVVQKKLAHVLWVPIESESDIPERKIHQPILWQPTAEQLQTLEQDWQELTDMLTFGEADRLTAEYGEALQVRPKAANSRVVRETVNSESEITKAIPRGFYLRPSFTEKVLQTPTP
tara:strand:- start:3718 stop:4368 length:651 start_codon:yes stop_codon:yes gene_type:complete